jgi:cell division protein FtsL
MKISAIIKKRKKLLVLAFFILILSGLVFYKFGILKYVELKQDRKAIQKKIDNIDNENKALRSEIDSLKNSDAKIERVAREKYGLKKANELVFTVDEK